VPAYKSFDSEMASFGRSLQAVKARKDAAGLNSITSEMEDYRVAASGLLPIQYKVLHSTLNELHRLNNLIQAGVRP